MPADKVVLITGASRGIGRAAALSLASAGWQIVLAARGQAALEETARAAEQAGATALAVPADVTDEGSVRRLIDTAEERFGPIDALVNAAGWGRFGPIEESESADWHAMMAANLTGTYFCCRHVIPGMLARGGGQIVNILSIAAKQPFPFSTAYCASKFGAYGFTLALAAEVRRRGIRVTALLPGAVDTPFWDQQGGGPDRTQMLRPEAVGDAVRWILAQPEGATADELVLMPPFGVL